MQRLHARGFTLIEMLVAIAVMAVLLGVAVPSFRSAGLGSQLRSASTDLLAGANLARGEAIKRNAPVNLCVSANETSCGSGGWEQGWIVIAPATATLAEKVLFKHSAAPTGFKITASSSTSLIAFQPTGVGATSATLTICRHAPEAGQQERVITIDAAGRAASRRTTTGSCP